MLLLVAGAALLPAANAAAQEESDVEMSAVVRTPPVVPAWAADAVWYQVFVSRFRNGDPANDPPHTWPWTTDWLRQPEHAPPQRTELFFRRYGGDLQGLREKLPYLRALGVNALYLNPVFAAASEHKYDATDLRHIDDTFGVAGSMARLQGETDDPQTWQWSESDRVFLEFLREAHGERHEAEPPRSYEAAPGPAIDNRQSPIDNDTPRPGSGVHDQRRICVIIDGVFNHCGKSFWAFQDVQARGQASPYASWFDIIDFGPPLQWHGWGGKNTNLVRFARSDDTLAPGIEEHIFAVTRRWMDPDGDGDPSDGVDGWRVDAAEQVPHGFWKRWRRLVKSINPEAIIIGEIWTEPAEWLEGDEFDVVTNYRFAEAVTRFCRRGPQACTATQFAAELERLYARFDPAVGRSMINLLSSHDTDRVLSMLANPYRPYDTDNQPGAGTPPYDPARPDEEVYRRQKLAAVLQFTCPGAPMVYYGDEVGVYGADDPYCRHPMWWPGLGDVHGAGYRPDLLEHYRRLGRLRAERASLRQGGFRLLLADDARRVVAYERATDAEQTVVIVNCGTKSAAVRVRPGGGTGVWQAVTLNSAASGTELAGSISADEGGVIETTCGGLSAVVLSRAAEPARP